MAKAILGRKLGMTQIFTEEGQVVPVTVVESGNNVVIQNKTVENDGYNAVQIGFGAIKEHKVNSPMKGHFAKAGVAPVKYVREMRLENASEYNVGDTIGVDIFSAGELVDVTGTSKGKGFAGGIKRHNFARGPMGHGSKSHREPGSTGAMISGHGGRVLKGKKLPGQMVTEQNADQQNDCRKSGDDRKGGQKNAGDRPRLCGHAQHGTVLQQKRIIERVHVQRV